jgi:single-stranded DNA-binding protein
MSQPRQGNVPKRPTADGRSKSAGLEIRGPRFSWFLPKGTGPSHKAPARLGSSGLSLLGAPRKWGNKRRKIYVLPPLSDDHWLRRRRPGAASSAEQQRLEVHRSLSVATQRSWKNTDDEWASKTEWHRVCVFRPRLAEYVATTIKKGSHVLVEGSLVSTTYRRRPSSIVAESFSLTSNATTTEGTHRSRRKAHHTSRGGSCTRRASVFQ